MTVTANYLVTVSREMGQAMQDTAYSPIFNEALDFSCAVFDERRRDDRAGRVLPGAARRDDDGARLDHRRVRSRMARRWRRLPAQRPLLGHEPPARAHGGEGGLRRRRARRHRRLHRAHGRGRRARPGRLPWRRAGGVPRGAADSAGEDRQSRGRGRGHLAPRSSQTAGRRASPQAISER